MSFEPHTPPTAQSATPHVDVSVALCTHNGAVHLGELLNSLVSQTRRPDELVVQDDASEDSTTELLAAFAERAPFPVRIEQNPVRLGSTRNFEAALARCSGRVVALADQDDVWYPSKLDRLAHEFELDPTITMVFSNADLIDEDGRPIGRSLWDTRRVGRVLRRNRVVPARLFARRALTTGCTMAIRRRAVEAALPFPDELADERAPMRHDRWLSLIAASVGTVQAIPEPLLAFRVHPRQETGVLVGAHFPLALALASARLVTSRPDSAVDERAARCAQLRVAAARAEELGDFEEAEALLAIADGHLLRASGTGRATDEIRALRHAVVGGVYDRGFWGWMAIAGDAVRALHPRRVGSPG